eukprot:c21127_g1_i1 orf=1-156(-)
MHIGSCKCTFLLASSLSIGLLDDYRSLLEVNGTQLQLPSNLIYNHHQLPPPP